MKETDQAGSLHACRCLEADTDDALPTHPLRMVLRVYLCDVSRILRERGITAVTATPAERDGVVVGRPLHGNTASISRTATHTVNVDSRGEGATPQRALEEDSDEASLLLARICNSAGNDRDLRAQASSSASSDAIAIPTVVDLFEITAERTGNVHGERLSASLSRQDEGVMRASVTAAYGGERGVHEGAYSTTVRRSWAGQDREEDWVCLFQAYRDLDYEAVPDGRLSCLIAREVRFVAA